MRLLLLLPLLLGCAGNAFGPNGISWSIGDAYVCAGTGGGKNCGGTELHSGHLSQQAADLIENVAEKAAEGAVNAAFDRVGFPDLGGDGDDDGTASPEPPEPLAP